MWNSFFTSELSTNYTNFQKYSCIQTKIEKCKTPKKLYYSILLHPKTHDMFLRREPLHIEMGASVHEPTQINRTYINTIRSCIYETRRTGHPHSPVLWYEQWTLGPSFTAPLHGILSSYVLIFMTPMSTSKAHRHHNYHDHSAAVSIYHSLGRQVSDANTVIVIVIFMLYDMSDLIPLIVFDLIWLTMSDLFWLNTVDFIWLTVSDFILLTLSDLIRLTISDLIRLMVFDWTWIIIFYSIWLTLTYFSIWVTTFESYYIQTSGSPTLTRVSSK